MSLITSVSARSALQLARETVESWRAGSNEAVWRRSGEGTAFFSCTVSPGRRACCTRCGTTCVGSRSPRTRSGARSRLRRHPGHGDPDPSGAGGAEHSPMRRDRLLDGRARRRLSHQVPRPGPLHSARRDARYSASRSAVLERMVVAAGRWARSANQMRAGSEFLDQLLRMPPPADTSILSVAGSEDTIVPPEATHLEGAGYRNLVVPGLDHWTCRCRAACSAA